VKQWRAALLAHAALRRVLLSGDSAIRNIAVEVPLGRAEGIPNRCVANFDNLRTISRAALQRRAGSVSTKRHVEIKRAMGERSLGMN